MSPVKPPPGLAKVQDTLRRYALTYPESHEDFPWDHLVVKVRGKLFVTLGATKETLSMSVKLPRSRHEALLLPFTEPTHYGMGKHGWVTAHFERGDEPPISILVEWIDESYRAIAPKTLVKQLDAEGGAPAGAVKEQAAGKKAARKKAAKKKAAKKKVAKKKVARKKAAKKPSARKPATKQKATRKTSKKKTTRRA